MQSSSPTSWRIAAAVMWMSCLTACTDDTGANGGTRMNNPDSPGHTGNNNTTPQMEMSNTTPGPDPIDMAEDMKDPEDMKEMEMGQDMPEDMPPPSTNAPFTVTTGAGGGAISGSNLQMSLRLFAPQPIGTVGDPRQNGFTLQLGPRVAKEE